MIKKLFKSFTFYFAIASLLMVYTHYTGGDSHGIMLFHTNVILKSLMYTGFAEHVISAGPVITCGSLSGSISVYWYVAHFISFLIYGLVLDILKGWIIKSRRKKHGCCKIMENCVTLCRFL